jgi:hypothetical protein
MKRCLTLVLSVFLVLGSLAPQRAFAQDANSESPLQVRNALGVILLSGLVGGIIGLSTLSFYPKPQDNIRNIFFGAGAGMIIATLGTTLAVAQTPPEKADSDLQWAPLLDPSSLGLMLSYRF